MALLALCGRKHALLVKRVPLSQPALEAVAEAFAAQEAAFRHEAVERPYDQNWQSEDDEISTTPIPESVTVFGQIKETADTALQPVNDIEEIRGLAMKVGLTNNQRILVQAFAASQSLVRRGIIALLLEKGTYTQLESPGFQLGNKLICIVEDDLIKFRSLYNLGHVIDTSVIFTAATDDEVVAFADTYTGLFQISDTAHFVDNSNRNTRKYIASLMRSNALQGKTAAALAALSEPTNLTIEVQGDRIVMPQKSKEITELMRFLNDGRFVGPVSGNVFVTNSRRPAG